MKSVRLTPDGTASRLESLALPFLATGPAATPQDRAATPDPRLAEAVASVRPLNLPEGHSEVWAGQDTRRLTFVAAGGLFVEAQDAVLRLAPGDVLVADTGLRTDHRLHCSEESRVLHVDVLPAWQPQGIVPPPVESAGTAGRPTALREMYVADGIAHFRPFDRLFDSTEPQPLDALKFISFSPGHAGDWHTDATINLVCVASGVLELEVGGDNAVERFLPGDVCLVEDQHGQGHILRAHGETRILAITLPDEHRWNSDRAAGDRHG